MALSDFVRNSCYGSFKLRDGTGTPVELASLFDLGDVNISGLSGPVLNEVEDYEARGNYISSAHTTRRYPQITFTSYHTGEGASDPGSVQAFLTKNTPYGSNVSVQGAGRVYAVTFELNIDDESGSDWQSIFNNCVPIDLSFGEAMDGDKWSFTLKCLGAITGDLAAAELSI